MRAALTRREFTRGSLAGFGALGASGCSGHDAAYDAILADMTAPLPAAPDFAELETSKNLGETDMI